MRIKFPWMILLSYLTAFVGLIYGFNTKNFGVCFVCFIGFTVTTILAGDMIWLNMKLNSKYGYYEIPHTNWRVYTSKEDWYYDN